MRMAILGGAFDTGRAIAVRFESRGTESDREMWALARAVGAPPCMSLLTLPWLPPPRPEGGAFRYRDFFDEDKYV